MYIYYHSNRPPPTRHPRPQDLHGRLALRRLRAHQVHDPRQRPRHPLPPRQAHEGTSRGGVAMYGIQLRMVELNSSLNHNHAFPPRNTHQTTPGDQGHGAAGPVPAPQQVCGAARRVGCGGAEGQGRHGADLPPRRQGGPNRAPGHPGP